MTKPPYNNLDLIRARRDELGIAAIDNAGRWPMGAQTRIGNALLDIDFLLAEIRDLTTTINNLMKAKRTR